MSSTGGQIKTILLEPISTQCTLFEQIISQGLIIQYFVILGLKNTNATK